ncbi:MAG: periplasmic heavy metal sensor, partial [Deltaproteobacteria bacterium]|nr:periplasmic heavy metal sensor [Deltaproteobacteria bacterium]
MNKKSLMVILVLSLAINASVLGTMGYHYYRDASLAKGAPCPLSPAHQHLYQDLGLSTLQLAQMEPIARNFHERLSDLGAAMKGKNGGLVELLGQKDVDQSQVERLRKEIAGIQDEIQREVITHIIESKKILDSKQQERFFALMR